MYEKIESSNRLQPKDLITVGVFTAILAILTFVISWLSFIPIFIPLLTVFIPLIEGIPFMLFLTKVKKFGMVFIMGILVGVIDGFLGMGYYAMIAGVLFGFLADIVFKSGKYASKSKSILGYGIFSMWLIGNYIPIVIARDSYYQNLLDGGMGQEYVDALTRYVPNWSLIVLLAASFVCGIIGGLIGLKALKKHFERAGIAG